MTPYSISPEHPMFVKSYDFLAFAKNMSKKLVKTIKTVKLKW